jgi:putative ABC transport system substrate-binding protein
MNRSKQSRMIGKTIMVVWLVALTIASFHLAEGQQPKKIPRIGFLGASSASSYSTRIPAFREGLHDLGYVEGKNIAIEYRYADGKLDQLAALAAELVRLKVDIIVASGPAASAAKKVTTTTPVIFLAVADAVEEGLVVSLARPGGNLTGLSILAPELSGKRLELLKESFPRITRVAVLWTGSRSGRIVLKESLFKETETAAQGLGLHIQSLEVRSLNDFDSAFTAAIREGAHALITTPQPLINTNRARIIEFAVKNRLPAMYAVPEFVEAGGLMSYATSYTDLFRRAATYVDKILKGAKPADLPVEQSMKFEFIINLKAAKQIGLTIPQSVLFRADKVMK